MNLKDFLASRDKPPELYWSLVLESGWVQAGLWFIKDENAQVSAVGPASPWETEEDLVGACDTALSSAVQKLPDEVGEPSKTVFGVPSSWVKDGEIVDEYLSKIKKICTDLSLEPVGFVVLPEAVAHYYKSEEGTPVSAIVLGLGKEFLEVSVFKLGNLVGTTSVARSVSTVEDTAEGLSRFEGASPLPSRFIVYDGREGEVEGAKEELLGAAWEKFPKVKFLHTPKVEGLISDKKVLAVSLAGASEIGHASHVSEDEVQTNEEASEFKSEDVPNVVPPEADVSAKDLGFAIGEDVSEKIQKPLEPSKPNHLPLKSEVDNFVPKFSSKVKSLFHSLTGKISFRPKINGGFNRNRLYITLFFLLILAAGTIVFWWFYPTATVLVYVTPKSFESESTVSIVTDGTSDIGSAILPGRVVDTKVSGDKSAKSTGSKLVGDKAKGSVKIGNSTANDINLAAGTAITSSGNLSFTTDSDASVSAGLDSFTPGTQTLSVTASDIGAQYNLAKGEAFSVGNYQKAEISAQSLSDFSGGSSHEISAISKDDQDKLESALTSDLTGSAKDNITSQISSGEIFTGDLVSTDKIDETFSGKVGDESQDLKLSLNLDAKGIAIDKSKLIEYSKSMLKDRIPQGFVLRDDQISFKFTLLSASRGIYKYKVAISANFLPQISVTDLANQISGKTPGASEDLLSKIPGFTQIEIKIKSPFPSFLKVLPEVTKNINLEIVGEKP